MYFFHRRFQIDLFCYICGLDDNFFRITHLGMSHPGMHLKIDSVIFADQSNVIFLLKTENQRVFLDLARSGLFVVLRILLRSAT